MVQRNLETREIVEDLRVCESMNVMVCRQLPPGIKGTETWFYYEFTNNTSASDDTEEDATRTRRVTENKTTMEKMRTTLSSTEKKTRI